MKNALLSVGTLGLSMFVFSAAGHAQAPKEGEKPAAAAPGAGAPPAPPAAPKPPPENDVIKKSSGSWSCEGVAKSPEGQEMKYKATWSVKPALGGHWYTIVYKRSKMGTMPAFEGNATVGYDVASKKYTFVGFDNYGGWIDLSSNDGAAYAGQGGPMGKVTPVKFTFTPGKDKKGEESDKLFDVTMDFGAATGSESCKK